MKYDKQNDPSTNELLEKAERDSVDTCFTRMEAQARQCKFGTDGVCCRICYMGPCRITAKSPRGVCGADADTIVARNLLREAAAGAAAHSDHGRHLVHLLKRAASEEEGDFVIKDEQALERVASAYGIVCEDRETPAVAAELAARLMEEFTAQDEPPHALSFAPDRRRMVWRESGVEPNGVDRTIVEALHRTHMGVDHDYEHLLMHAFSTALSDGWGGSRVATMVSDILFGTPSPVRAKANLGVLREDTVNIVVHGHEPELSELLAIAVRDPDIRAEAEKAGAEGVTLAGICCTANEILMRHGIPVAGNFLQQELAIVTGAVEMMVVDVQCCMPSLPEVAAAYHTEIVTTSPIAKTRGATHMPLDERAPLESAKRLVRRAIEAWSRRDPEKVSIPDGSRNVVAGFSVEAIRRMLGGTYRATFRPLNDAIIEGRIRGVAGIVGCTNPKVTVESYINPLTRELVKNNILVIKTGCAAIASGKAGALTPEEALEHAGDGLREVCEAVGMPPVLHMGSCVDCSRILEAATEIVKEGGLGDDIGSLPAVGVAPEWMSEKAVSIAMYFVASGVDVVLGHPFRVAGSENVGDFLRDTAREHFGASFHDAPDPAKAAETIIEIIDNARAGLGIDRKAERKLWDMEDRRHIHV